MDPIDRQEALDAICDNCDAVKASCPHYPCSRYVALEKLAPAQPEGKDIIGTIKKYTNYHVGECRKAFDIAIDYLRSKSRNGLIERKENRMSELIFDDIKRGWLFRGVTWETLVGETRRGSFHKWVVIADRIYAIVELENGTMTTVRMRDIKFVNANEGKGENGNT